MGRRWVEKESRGKVMWKWDEIVGLQRVKEKKASVVGRGRGESKEEQLQSSHGAEKERMAAT